jgi:hypothetical protein
VTTQPLFVPQPNQSNVLTALRAFLLQVLPANTPVIQAQINRVSEPSNTDFVLMTPTRNTRLATNLDEVVDCAFTASASGTVLTVSAILLGTIVLDHQLMGATVTGSPVIVSQSSGTPGKAGVYVLSASQPTITSETMACGVFEATQSVEVCVQLDVHGPNSADNAQVISTLFRDEYAVDQFTTSGFDVAPLYADDPKQLPFENENQQIEMRWVIDAMMNANQTVTAPQAFFTAVKIGLVPVDIFYAA